MVKHRRLLATGSPRSASPLRRAGRAVSPALRVAVRGVGGRVPGAGSPLLPRPQRRAPLTSRSLSLDTGLDTNNAASCSDPETATDVVNSCEQYLQQQHSSSQAPEPSQAQQAKEQRPPRRRLSSIPCDSSPIAEEECGEDGGSRADGDSLSDQQPSASPRSSLLSSRRSSLASMDDLHRKSSFVNKCMTRVRGFIKK